MRHRRLLLLLAPALIFVAATCVTKTEQRGPAGPWVVEVVNTANQSVPGVFVQAQITDATGRALGFSNAFTCPQTLPPYGRGAAEVFRGATRGGGISGADNLPLPLHATMSTGHSDVPPTISAGLAARVTESHPGERYAMVEVRNTRVAATTNATICATLRGPSGELLEVGYTPLFPTTMLAGTSQTVPIFFNTFPADATVALFPSWSNAVPAVRIDPSRFTVESTALTGNRTGRVLHIVGEFTNTDSDLRHVRVVGHLDGTPQTRVEGAVACGTGVVGNTAKTVVTFALPVPAGITQPRLVVDGIEGVISPVLTPLAVGDVALEPLGSFGQNVYAVGVTAPVADPKPLGTTGECATLRDSTGRAIGAARMMRRFDTFPGEPVKFLGVAPTLGVAASADVTVYGEVVPPPSGGPVIPAY